MQSSDVAFLTIAFQRGGAERVISTLSCYLRSKSMLILYADGNLGYSFTGEVLCLDGCQPSNSWLGRFLKRFIKLCLLLKNYRVKLLISFMPRPNLLAILLKCSGFYRGKLIINEVNVVSQRPIGFITRWCIAKLYPRADRVVVPSLDIRDDLVKCYGVPTDNISVIHNPFDVADIVQQAQETIVLPWIDSDVPIVISAGRLTDQKGFDLLIEAFTTVRSKMNVRLVLLGDGECEASLRQLVAERGLASDIYFAGWQSNPYAFFSRADLFVLSSRYEGFGNVIVEAMTCGLPIVSTDCPGGPAEILKNGECGLLVPPNNIEILADAILRILQDEELRQGFEKKSLERCQDFDVTRIVKQWQEEVDLCRA